MEKFKIISPMRGEQYTVEDVLNKLLVRRTFDCSILVVPYESVYEYGSDHDGHVHFEAESVSSAWTNSVNCKLLANIPYHRSGEGSYSFGPWASRPESGEDPEYRKTPMTTSVTASLGDDAAAETISFNWDMGLYPNGDDKEIDHIQDLLKKIVREAIVQMAFRGGFFEEAPITPIAHELLAAYKLPVEDLCQSEGCNFCTGVHEKCRLNTVNDEGYVVEYYQG